MNISSKCIMKKLTILLSFAFICLLAFRLFVGSQRLSLYCNIRLEELQKDHFERRNLMKNNFYPKSEVPLGSGRNSTDGPDCRAASSPCRRLIQGQCHKTFLPHHDKSDDKIWECDLRHLFVLRHLPH